MSDWIKNPPQNRVENFRADAPMPAAPANTMHSKLRDLDGLLSEIAQSLTYFHGQLLGPKPEAPAKDNPSIPLHMLADEMFAKAHRIQKMVAELNNQILG